MATSDHTAEYDAQAPGRTLRPRPFGRDCDGQFGYLMIAATSNLLAIGRLGVGALALLAPGTAASAFSVHPSCSNDWLWRLIGSRELVIAGAMLATTGPELRKVALLGAAVDGLDAISSAVELGRGKISASTFKRGAGTAVLGVALGLLASELAKKDSP